MCPASLLTELATGRALLCLAVGISVSGCAGPAPQGQPAAGAAARSAVVSYDGRYEGAMRVTGSSVNMNRRDCATSPRISIEVKDNRFSLATPHPEAVAATPTLRDRATPVYDAAIRPDGIIEGISNQTNATMRGRVSGARMSGEIYGLLCYYEFTADRV
jgi:hypothetical protein